MDIFPSFRFVFSFFVVLFLFFFLPVPSVRAQTACPTPASVPNVSITFPSCVGNVCNFTQGSCSWGSVSGASKFHFVVTEVETNSVVLDQQVDASVLSSPFSVKESNTYRCDVSAISSCGSSGPVASNSLLCKVDAAVTTTPAPTVASTPIPTSPPQQVFPVTGSSSSLILLGLGAFFLISVGVAFFIA